METKRSLPITFIASVAFCLSSLTVQAADQTEDSIPAEHGAIKIRPMNHATFEMEWNGKRILVDPVGGAGKFKNTPDVILVTDIHGDHMNADTLKGVAKEQTKIIAPQAVADQLPGELKDKVVVVRNGEKKEVAGVSVEGIPMYNLTEERLKFHNKGRGNGYVATLGGKRIYISGDTEDIPEMRALKNIDVAFVCMNLPYTMTVDRAADAVKQFKPKIVYPYHYRGSDTAKFKELVGNDGGIEVRLRDWYRQ